MNTPNWMKKATVFGYYRISSDEQAKRDMGKEPKDMGTLKDQRQYVHDRLKEESLPRPSASREFYEVRSAKNMDRPELKKLLDAMYKENNKGKRVFLAIKDPSRWTRNTIFGDEVYAEMYRRNIPIISLFQGGVLRGTDEAPRPMENFVFNIASGVATIENETKKEKALLKADALRSQGILAGSARTVFPFAQSDPIDMLVMHQDRLNKPKSEDGLNKAEFGRLMVKLTGRGGTTENGWRRLKDDHDSIKAKLTPEEYKQWYDFREKMREFYRMKDFDPAASAPIKSRARKSPDFGAFAVHRMVGGYLKEPFNEKFRMPSDEEIEEYYTNFKEYLGAKQFKKYRSVISKRGGRR